jgi:hypothetical protein
MLPDGLMAVVVAYERPPEAIPSWTYLTKVLTENVQVNCKALSHLLLYDNSANRHAPTCHIGPSVTYIHDPANGGTAAAYTKAIEVANRSAIQWLLLLDQDTILTDSYMQAMRAQLQKLAMHPPAAIVPWVVHDGAVISPARIRPWGSIAPLERKEIPIGQMEPLTAIASGCVLHVPTVVKIMPIPRDFWLDYVDHWIFSQFKARGLPVVVVETALEHDLSVRAPRSIGARRLKSILDGELAFHGSLGVLARAVYPIRLLARMLRYLVIAPRTSAQTFVWCFTHWLVPKR